MLNNNYVQRAPRRRLRGFSISFPENTERRLDVVRYSLEELREATGFGAEELNNRMVDFGIPGHWTSHHPFTSPEPLTLEPTESFSRAELDELADVYARVVDEAYEEPATIAAAPHRSSKSQMRFEESEIPQATARLVRDGRPRNPAVTVIPTNRA